MKTTQVFKPIKRANRNKRVFMHNRAMDVAAEMEATFTGEIQSTYGTSAYTAEFVKDGDYFYGWAIQNEDEKIDFVFGSGQMIFDGSYVTTDEDYYEVIGAGV